MTSSEFSEWHAFMNLMDEDPEVVEARAARLARRQPPERAAEEMIQCMKQTLPSR